MHTGRTSRADEGRGWGDTSTSQGTSDTPSELHTGLQQALTRGPPKGPGLPTPRSQRASLRAVSKSRFCCEVPRLVAPWYRLETPAPGKTASVWPADSAEPAAVETGSRAAEAKAEAACADAAGRGEIRGVTEATRGRPQARGAPGLAVTTAPQATAAPNRLQGTPACRPHASRVECVRHNAFVGAQDAGLGRPSPGTGE